MHLDATDSRPEIHWMWLRTGYVAAPNAQNVLVAADYSEPFTQSVGAGFVLRKEVSV